MAPVKLTDKDIDHLVRLVATEADHSLVWSHPEEYAAQVHGIVDTVLNRVASGKWGSSVDSVANANRQFSKIAGPKSNDPYGSVDKVPDSDIPAYLPNIVTSWVTARSNGTPSSVGGNLHYANPTFSDPSNMGWINALDGPKLGFGDSTHWHGTTAGYTPIEADVEYGPRAPADILQRLHDRVEEARGYGQIPPTPAIRADVLTELKNRAQGVAAPELTPRLTETIPGRFGIEDPRPPLDWGQFKEGVGVGGVGSLLDGSINPAAPNPQPQLLAERLGVRPLDASASAVRPTMEQLQAIRDVSRVLPQPSYQDGTLVDPATTDEVLGSIPVPLARPTAGFFAPQVQEDLRAPESPLSGSAAGRPGGATSVPMPGGKVDNGQPSQTVAPVIRQQETGKLANGKTVQIGQSYQVGDKLLIAEGDGKGGAVLRDVEDVRDDFLRTIDPNAPLLLENSLAGTAARMFAAPMIKEQIAQAGKDVQSGLGDLFSGALRTAGGMTQQARDQISQMFSRTAAPVSANQNLNTARQEQSAQRTTAPPLSANANLSQARSEQSSQRASVGPRSLSAPTAGLTAAERNAIAAYTPKTEMKSVPVTTTIRNPKYDAWVAKYGDGSQVQTAATGGMITKNQLAAIQNVNGAVQKPIAPVIPKAPPKTIKVTTTKQVPVIVTAPMLPSAPSLLKTKASTSTVAPVGAMTPVQQLQAQGMSAADAYARLVANANYGAGGFTSSGQSRTTSTGESWAANPPSTDGAGERKYGGMSQ